MHLHLGAHDVAAECRADHVRAVEVAGSSESCPQPSGCVGGHEVVCHPSPHGTLFAGRVHRVVLAHRHRGARAECVEVVHHHQHGPGAFGGGHQRLVDRRPGSSPLVVRRVRTVEDGGRAGGGMHQCLGVGRVGSHFADQCMCGPTAAAGDDGDGLPPGCEQRGDPRADRAGADDDVVVHGSLLVERCSYL